MMKIKCILVILLLSPPPIFGSKENLVPLFEDVHTNTKSESSQDKTKMINQPEDHIVAEGRDESEEYPDNNDYYSHPVCGNKPLGIRFGSCICGSESLSGQGDLAYGDSFCCVSPEDECYAEGSNVRCSTGAKHLKSQPCHDHCYNSYTTSEYLWYTASLFCEEENFCLPISQMCSGVCETEEAVCSPALRCSGQGYDNLISEIGVTEYTVQSLGGKITRSHEYCLAVNNDGYYDTISRLDEDKVVTKYVKLFDYNYLETCHSGYGEGIKCEEGDGCAPQSVWCGGTGRVCTTAGGTVGLDNVDLCRNNTFWMDRSCDWYESGNLAAFGARCTGDKKHCTFPWYTRRTANPTFSTACLDKSDQAFPINTSCVEYNYQFLNTYSKLWCGEWGGTVTRTVCESLVEFYSSQKNDNRIRDPHGCEKSCNTTGAADCLACQHKDYFHCETTGICIHQSNVCDGHPHPQCGGDDEIMYDCHQTYVKRRIVKNYATFICPSVIYPEMKTMAVVCDDIIECAGTLDEKFCDGPKNNTVPYILTCFTSLFYIVLKIVWWFHQRHIPLDDEIDDNDIPMEDLASTSNPDQEIQEADPSSEGSIRYKKALEELDRVHEITKKLTGYVSSDSEDETRE